MSGSAKDWGDGRKTKELPVKNKDKELRTTVSAAKNPAKEKDTPMNTPVWLYALRKQRYPAPCG